MQKIKLIKEPAYIYDLLFVFFLKYNTEYCMKHFVNKENAEEEKAFYEQVLKDFSPISDDLYVFFHAQQNGRCFLTHSYFTHYKSQFTTDYNFEFLQKELSNYPEVIKRLINFYFYDLTEEEVEACTSSNVELFEVIKRSNYSDTERSRLYEFFMNPNPYIQKLQYELMSKQLQLAVYYEKNYSLIFEAYNVLTIDILIDQLKPLRDYDFCRDEETKVYLSFCLLNSKSINILSVNEGVVGLLGINYLNAIKDVQVKKGLIKLDEFGAALSEESRVQMLDLMLERGEITCKDLERIFNFSGSTAYHHLTILLKNGVIKTRNEGKTIFYSVNNESFDVAIDILSKYSGKGKGVMR